MPAEYDVARLLIAYQNVWFSHFPSLSRRAEWHIVRHLCMNGRKGASVGALYGLAKQKFLLDDATVKERLSAIVQMGLCDLDPAGPIYARTVAMPTARLFDLFDAHLRDFALAFGDMARNSGADLPAAPSTGLLPQYRAVLLQPLALYGEQWSRMVDVVFDAGRLSPSRRIDAKRHLISSSHWNLLHRAICWHYETEGSAASKNGMLADLLAAQLLQLTGQTLQTTRDHIAYLLEVGLLQRMPGRALHVAVARAAMPEVHRALGVTAEQILLCLRGLSSAGPAEGGVPAVDRRVDRTVTVRQRGATRGEPEIEHILELVAPAGSSRLLVLRPPLTIGRLAPSELLLEGSDVSRTHCRIGEDGARVTVTDLKSTNGTFLNGKRIVAAVALKPGDRLQVGSHVLVYRQQAGSIAAADHFDGTVRAGHPDPQAGR